MEKEKQEETLETVKTARYDAEKLLEELYTDKTTVFERIGWFFGRVWDFFRHNAKWFFQKLFHGYSDIEIWNLGGTLARFAEPRLKKFMDETCGFPPDYATFEDWKSDLEKMLSAVNWAAHYEEYEDKIIEECGGYWARDKDGKSLWLEKVRAKDKETREGLELLGKRWMHLWW